MRHFIIGLIILIGLGNNCYSQIFDSHTKAVVELMSIIDMEDVLEESIEVVLNIQISQNPNLKKYKDVMIEFFNKYMSWESLKDDFIKIYKEEFTENEIKDLIEFYKTETGKKAMKKMPILMQKGSMIGQQRVQENIHELERMIQEKENK